MENRVSYIFVGIFVFILAIGAVFFVLWMGKYNQSEVYKYYKVITTESVSGLNLKAPVKLRGVSVGEVSNISINTKNSEEVVVLIRVKETTPIKQDSYALIELQGITGLSYIQLDGGTNSSELLETGEDLENYAAIYTHPSVFSRVDKTLELLGAKSQGVLDRTSSALSDKNLKNLETILQNLEHITSALDGTLKSLSRQGEKFDALIKEAQTFELSAIGAANEVKKMSQDLANSVNTRGAQTMDSMREASDTVSRVMGNLNQKIEDGSFDVDILLKESLLPLQNMLYDLQALIQQSSEGVDGLIESPSDLLFKESVIAPAPSEREVK